MSRLLCRHRGARPQYKRSGDDLSLFRPVKEDLLNGHGWLVERPGPVTNAGQELSLMIFRSGPLAGQWEQSEGTQSEKNADCTPPPFSLFFLYLFSHASAGELMNKRPRLSPSLPPSISALEPQQLRLRISAHPSTRSATGSDDRPTRGMFPLTIDLWKLMCSRGKIWQITAFLIKSNFRGKESWSQPKRHLPKANHRLFVQ